MLIAWWLVWCAVSAAAGSELAPDDATIRLFHNHSSSGHFTYRECMPEKANYIIKPHQQVNINIISSEVSSDTYCEWKDLQYPMNITTVQNITDNWSSVPIVLPDIGDEGGDLLCFVWWTNFPCSVHISIESEGAVDEYVQYNRSFSYVTMYVTSREPNNTMNELQFAENTSLKAECLLHIPHYEYTYQMHISLKNGSDVYYTHYDRVYYGGILHNVIYLNKESSDIVITCLGRNRLTNETLETELRLKYREWCRTGNLDSLLLPVVLTISLPLLCMIVVTAGYYFWRLREKRKASSAKGSRAHESDSNQYEEIRLSALCADGGDPRASSSSSNRYEEVYDVVYDERLRIEKRRKELHQAKRPPPPPSLETIPVRAHSRNQFVPVGPGGNTIISSQSINPTSDLYLLKIDSDGYEIPDELRFISLPPLHD